MNDQEESLINYYSLMELLEKLGKEGVAELVAKGKPRKISRGEMIYFLREDVHRIMGDEIIDDDINEPEDDINDTENDDDSAGLIVDKIMDASDIVARFSFKETLLIRQDGREDEKVYHHKVLDLNQEVYYGRSRGNPETMAAFKGHGIISSLHGKLYLDQEGNLLYQNIGVNKSKVRGCRDQSYNLLDQNEIGILVERQVFDEVIVRPKPLLMISIKLGYQLKPYFIIRIKITKKKRT